MQAKHYTGEASFPNHSAARQEHDSRPASHTAPLRLLLQLLLIGAQALAIGLLVHPRSAQHGGALALLPQLGIAIKYLIYFFTALLLALTARLPALWRELAKANAAYRPRGALLMQWLAFGTLLFVIGVLIPNAIWHIALPVENHETVWMALLLSTIAAALVTSLLSLAPASYWRGFLIRERLPLLLALVFTIGIYYITGIFSHSWDDYLSIPTIAVSKFLLGLFYDGVYADVLTKQMGIGDFIVLISSTCSGYEGMAMITAFLAWYSLTFRQDLKYPNALLLYPVAILAMWLFNCIRIAVLIAIGYAISPDIAMQGFHSNAGWIYFLCMSIGLILIARRMTFFTGKPVAGAALIQIDAHNVLLLPELVLLIATLLTAAMSAGFDWLYPLRMLATGIALAYFWKRFALGKLSIQALPVLIGVAVFLVWLAMVPVSAEKSQMFGAHLAEVSGATALCWLLIRALGATLIVPLAEELAFRGYLIDLLSKPSASNGQSYRFAWLPLLISSVCFGALHSQWVAGILAGIGYGLARALRGKIADAVIAHAVTNGLLAIYVLTTQQWSYW